jgi:hypothetical protein
MTNATIFIDKCFIAMCETSILPYKLPFISKDASSIEVEHEES